jgi:hypothetical protein
MTMVGSLGQDKKAGSCYENQKVGSQHWGKSREEREQRGVEELIAGTEESWPRMAVCRRKYKV